MLTGRLVHLDLLFMKLDHGAAMSDEELLVELTKVKGIGPWVRAPFILGHSSCL